MLFTIDKRMRYAPGVKVDAGTELVVASDIARRLDLSRQRINQLQSQPGFPKPIGRLALSNVWRWATVEAWAIETGRLTPPA